MKYLSENLCKVFGFSLVLGMLLYPLQKVSAAESTTVEAPKSFFLQSVTGGTTGQISGVISGEDFVAKILAYTIKVNKLIRPGNLYLYQGQTIVIENGILNKDAYEFYKTYANANPNITFQFAPYAMQGTKVFMKSSRRLI